MKTGPLLAKAHQALREHPDACAAFGKAYEIQKANPDVAREYVFECLEIGNTTEAIAVAEHALALSPRDAGLLENLALTYAIAGRNSDALSKVEEALAIDPTDKITLSLKQRIREILDGKRPQPKSLREFSKK